MKKLFLGLLLFSSCAHGMDLSITAAANLLLDPAPTYKTPKDNAEIEALAESLKTPAAPIAHKDIKKMRQIHEQSKFSCPHCYKAFKTKSGLNGHRKAHNKKRSNAKKPVQPQAAARAAAAVSTLVAEPAAPKFVPLTVTDGFKCPFCGYFNKRKQCMVVHIRTHTGERPYKCTLCDYAAIDNSTLTRHIRTHTGEKPYRCTLPGCDFATAQSHNLTAHTRIHTGEKPHKCTLCDYAATQQSSLIKHMKSHTSKQQPKDL